MDLGGFGVVGALLGAVDGGLFGLLRLGEESGGGFEAFDDAAGVIVLADGLQEAHGLGSAHADHQRVDGGNQADGQGPAPAVGLGNDKGADDGGQNPADGQECFKSDHDATADGTGRELGDERGGHGQLGAQAQADQEAEDQQQSQRGG